MTDKSIQVIDADELAKVKEEITDMVNVWLNDIYHAPDMHHAIMLYMSACETFLKHCQDKVDEAGGITHNLEKPHE